MCTTVEEDFAQELLSQYLQHYRPNSNILSLQLQKQILLFKRVSMNINIFHNPIHLPAELNKLIKKIQKTQTHKNTPLSQKHLALFIAKYYWLSLARFIEDCW